MEVALSRPSRRRRFIITKKDKLAFNFAPSGRSLQPTELVFRILDLFDPQRRYTYLPRDGTYQLLGEPCDPDYFRKLLADMAREPYKWLDCPMQQIGVNHLAKQIIYTRGDGANPLLITHERPTSSERPAKQYKHQLLGDLVDASIELGVMRNPELDLLLWHRDILNHPKTPEHVKRLPDPCSIPVGSQKLRPDGLPYVIRRTLKDGTTRALPLFKEIDRNTEQTTYTPRKHNTIEEKYTRWERIFRERIYQTHFGFPAAMVLFITTSEQHMHHLMAHAGETMGKCSWLLFKTIPDYGAQERGTSIPLTTRYLDEPYLRVGFPPFSLKTLEDVPDQRH